MTKVPGNKYVFIVNNEKFEHFTITINDDNKRVDNVVRKFLPDLPLKIIFKSLRNGDILVNNKKVKQNSRVNTGDIISIYNQFLSHKRREDKSTSGLDKNRIIFENAHLIIYNKKLGELVHGSNDSLDRKVKEYLKQKTVESLSFSPGPLHRLDRNTQGLIVFSVSLAGARFFTDLLQQGYTQKFYLTVVEGTFTKKEKWVDKLSRDEKSLKSYSSNSGKEAITIFTPIYTKNNLTVAIVEIKTGRTHQIRVQCALHNRPLAGDIKYSGNKNFKDYYLSAISLSINKKNDIINKNKIYLPFTQTDYSMLKSFLSQEEINLVDRLLKKELDNNESI